jgi:peptidyl-prolyl cis-trans isomerase D
MLEFIRQNIGGLLGAVIVGALVFAFALSFGAQSRGWGKGQSIGTQASVEGVEISETDFKYAVNMIGGRDVSQDAAAYDQLRRTALEGLIERQLLLNLALSTGISASRDEAEDRIVGGEIFLTVPVEKLAERLQSSFMMSPTMATQVLIKTGHQVRRGFENTEGIFDLEEYQNWVRYYLQVTEENFIEQQRLEVIAERVRRLLASGIRVSEQEVRDTYERDNDTASISYIRLLPGYFADKLDPTPEDLAAYAEGHTEEVAQYYETNKFKYTNLERMARARHILIKIAEDAEEQEKTRARQEMDGLLARIEAGEDFATLARQHSEDPGSGLKGGDLGYNPRGRMVPEFDEVMFSLEPGQVSDVVETKYGLHVIKLIGFREGNISLEEATEEIADILYRRAEGRARAEATAEEYQAKLKEGASMDSLVPAAEEGDKAPDHLKLKVRHTAPFSRSATSIPGLGRAQEIVAAAFELTPDASLPERVFKVHDDFVVFSLKERSVPNDDDFDKQRDELKEELLALKQAAWLRDRIRDLKSAAEKSGEIQSQLAATPTIAPGRREGPAADMPLGPEGDEGSASPADEPREPAAGGAPPSSGDEEDEADDEPDEEPAEAAEEPGQADEADEADEAEDAVE